MPQRRPIRALAQDLSGARTRQAGLRHSPRIQRIHSMSLINLVVTLVVVGVALWAINTYIPMDQKIKTILNVVVVILVVLWLLRGFGLLGGIGAMDVGG
jgi:hypothetical protein